MEGEFTRSGPMVNLMKIRKDGKPNQDKKGRRNFINNKKMAIGLRHFPPNHTVGRNSKPEGR